MALRWVIDGVCIWTEGGGSRSGVGGFIDSQVLATGTCRIRRQA